MELALINVAESLRYHALDQVITFIEGGFDRTLIGTQLAGSTTTKDLKVPVLVEFGVGEFGDAVITHALGECQQCLFCVIILWICG